MRVYVCRTLSTAKSRSVTRYLAITTHFMYRISRIYLELLRFWKHSHTLTMQEPTYLASVETLAAFFVIYSTQSVQTSRGIPLKMGASGMLDSVNFKEALPWRKLSISE